nr:AraC family transcriptional regulator [Rhodoferax sp. U11-2br]
MQRRGLDTAGRKAQGQRQWHHARLGGLIAPSLQDLLPRVPCVMGTSPLMRSLVQRAVAWAEQDQLQPEQERILAVLQDEIRSAPQEPLHLPMPTDRRLLRVAEAILRQPQDTRTLAQWADWAGLSAQTLGRLCQQETGCSFAQWRQQARLIHALERLA